MESKRIPLFVSIIFRSNLIIGSDLKRIIDQLTAHCHSKSVDFCQCIFVPEQVIRGQLALFNTPMRVWIETRICAVLYGHCAVRIILTCDVYLCDLQVLEIWDFDSTARSRQAKQGKAKPSQQCGKSSGASQAMWLKRVQSSLLWGRGQDGLIRKSANDALATQVCTNQLSLTDEGITQ